MTDSLSPRLKPRPISPSAKSCTRSRYAAHVHACQMPRSFSRMAVRRGNSRAFRNRYRGSVLRSAMPDLARFGLAEIRFHHGGVDAHLVRFAFRDLLPHVEHGHAIGH